MPSTRYSTSPTKYPHSSDTEQLETPPRKRFRSVDNDDDDADLQSPSSASYVISRKRQKRGVGPRKQHQQKAIDLERILRDCAEDDPCRATLLQLKDISNDERLTRPLVKSLIDSAKRAVLNRCRSRQHLLLETELYAKWLEQLEYVAIALDNALSAKMLGTRKRVPSLGRPAYTILYNLIDEFIDEVNIHHDICCTSDSGLNLYPPTMSLVDEAKDASTDARSEESVNRAEAALKNFDRVMANAVRRYKAEQGRNNATLAERISAQEHNLAKGCCLLCEQTGYGAEENDVGETLMEETRGVMTLWKNEYDDCEDQLDESD